MKKFLSFFIEPFKVISNRNISEKIASVFTKYKVLYVIASFIITAIIIFFIYAKPHFGW
ncbi:hypothetical protein [Mariniplasma anaerobium]|uniref:Uncharacterized protein n=1 Tax=Mariniplasma anaerobium TaxID=2735436 RepID=A0A7U9TH64_9MOLU|nr:hypothetical protein [Mariniplasma anaerobium]BCR35137.1 hypothetical protein MPAN_000300 [Mariniplasma anaerobium]